MGIIPAYAGSTSNLTLKIDGVEDHPRIRGEHISWAGHQIKITGSSPHTRGALRRLYGQALQVRIIPAYAGSTRKGDYYDGDR